jgi:hypothetical protein
MSHSPAKRAGNAMTQISQGAFRAMWRSAIRQHPELGDMDKLRHYLGHMLGGAVPPPYLGAIEKAVKFSRRSGLDTPPLGGLGW